MTLIHIGGFFLLVNIISLLLMAVDKYKAVHNKYRISEKTLFISALPFSSYGFYLGMKLFRHKTQKFSFKLGSLFLMIVHTSIILYILMNQQSFEGIFSQFTI